MHVEYFTVPLSLAGQQVLDSLHNTRKVVENLSRPKGKGTGVHASQRAQRVGSFSTGRTTLKSERKINKDN